MRKKTGEEDSSKDYKLPELERMKPKIINYLERRRQWCSKGVDFLTFGNANAGVIARRDGGI